MLLFGLFENERLTLDIPAGATVKIAKTIIKEKLRISDDLYLHEKKILVLTYAGADLEDDWVFTELGILPGTTVRIELKEEVKPVLFVHCTYTGENMTILDIMQVGHLPVEELRSRVSRMSGLPIGIFRLVTSDGKEMFDGHILENYKVDVGDTVRQENWDGWNDFLYHCRKGDTKQALGLLVNEDVVGPFQVRVGLFISAHFGHLDLARCLLRRGGRSDEIVGEHPQRQWCSKSSHIESKRAPVHQATEMGQIGVLRLFVNTDVCCLYALDGEGLAPINIALRKKIKNCASFLLTKQWSRVIITKTLSLNLATFVKMKKWGERAKEAAFLKYGPTRSSLRRRTFTTGPLVSHGVALDGYSPSPMTGKSKAPIAEREKRRGRLGSNALEEEDPEQYFRTVNLMGSINANAAERKGAGAAPGKWGKLLVDKAKPTAVIPGVFKNVLLAANAKSERSEADPAKSPFPFSPVPDARPPGATLLQPLSHPLTERSEDGVENHVKFPPIATRIRLASVSQVNIASVHNADSHAPEGKGHGGAVPTASKLIKSKGAFAMGGQPLPSSGGKLSQSLPNVNLTSSHGHGGHLESIGSMSTVTDDTPRHQDTDRSDGSQTTRAKGKRKKRSRGISSVVTLNQGQSGEAAIPLPLQSTETDRRPFFYHNGMREEDIVKPTMGLVEKYTGTSSRDRAIRSLSIANSFEKKPWLTQVRIALALTSSTVKRDVGHLKTSPRKNVIT